MEKTIIVEKTKLPDFLPHGWKKQVSIVLGIHVNTVTNALKAGRGTTYERIKQTAIMKWGNDDTFK
ncbi:MAG: hypothetical protein E6767_10860 [Dysgonomonas sp.]|nr:hypothetical protein [Dysgonomonas sp.]